MDRTLNPEGVHGEPRAVVRGGRGGRGGLGAPGPYDPDAKTRQLLHVARLVGIQGGGAKFRS